ncbi:MAG: hypothetical protein PHS07_03315 [Patescibacteria group bacterium]|nr:hypothetical protein [Patescibacteria group bacterium]
MQKQTRSYIFLLIFLLIAIGTFVLIDYLANRSDGIEPGAYTKIEQDIIKITEYEDRKVVKNETQGVEFTIPKDWEMDKNKGSFYSNLDKDSGCKLSTYISNRELNLDDLEQNLRENIISEGSTVKSLEYSRIKVDDLDALKQELETEEFGKSVSVYIPKGDKVFGFVMYIFSQDDLVYCNNKMESILGSVSF